ncbi:rhodanese-like domain-containing protein [Flavobacteriales bacterium]|jgi:rhodanese-related sulfurtransferase|nr:rhodanese-like domain-containing protein [Flavobacteriales bacterium]MDB3926539.1 rhodanese-like domain-containing protein [Flavobacteriales bacterium]
MDKKIALIDVRTPLEFNSGNVKGSINIPMNEVPQRLDEIRELEPMIVFCKSGVRSQKVLEFLKDNGIVEVENGGGWMEVNASVNQ